jgi:hypothetical protein
MCTFTVLFSPQSHCVIFTAFPLYCFFTVFYCIIYTIFPIYSLLSQCSGHTISHKRVKGNFAPLVSCTTAWRKWQCNQQNYRLSLVEPLFGPCLSVMYLYVLLNRPSLDMLLGGAKSIIVQGDLSRNKVQSSSARLLSYLSLDQPRGS